MDTSGLLQSQRETLHQASLTLQETQSIYDSMNIQKSNLFFYFNQVLYVF